jgi:hypothetical protein
MRRTLIALAAAGLLIVSGCSDSDSGGSDDAEDAANESEQEGSGGEDTPEGFCSEFQALEEQFAEDPEAANDVDAVIGALEGLEPPQAIADDFAALIEVSRQAAEIDMNDPAAVEEAQRIGEESAESQERVETYLQDECGFEPSGTGG